MAFVSVHGTITAAQVSTTASIVGQYTKVRVLNQSGLGGIYFSRDATATNQGAGSAFLAGTTGSFWDFDVVPSGGAAVFPASITTTVSLYSSVTNAAYSITGY